MEARRRKGNRKSVPTKLQNGSRAGSVIMLEMDTTTPISDLQKIIGTKLNSRALDNHEIYLQDIRLNPKLSIYDQAIRVSGSVELKVQVETNDDGTGRLTIVEVAKNMTDEEIRALGGDVNGIHDTGSTVDSETGRQSSRADETEKDDLGIPNDPTVWTQEQVHSWMLRIAEGYNLDPLMIKKPGMDGKQLCALPIEDFFIKFPYGNIFWSHLTFLRKLACPDMNDNDVEVTVASDKNATSKQNKTPSSGDQETVTIHITEDSSTKQSSSIDRSITSTKSSYSSSRSHTSAPGGQIQLWQFLLELLTDADERNVITWVGNDGGFKFLDPERVAQKWGERKGKPAMNYEKLSRALRYYYDGEMISKVAGRRFEYKFVCNLKEILGFNAAELHAMVAECYEKRRAERTAPVKTFGTVTGVIENGTYFPR